MSEQGTGCMLSLIVLVLAIPATIFRAWVMQQLWGWFVLPGFGVAVPSMAILLGLSTLIGMFVYHDTPRTRDDTVADAALRTGATMFAWPLMSLAVGWVYQHWV